MRRLLTPLVPALAALAFGASALADDIYLTDGRTISEVDINSETLSEVTYRKDRKDGRVDADKVLSVTYSEKPQLVDAADAAMAEDLFLDAESDLINFLEGVKDKGSPRRHPWARAYAYYRLVVVFEVMGRVDELGKTADDMIGLEPDSRYMPIVLGMKAQILADSGDKAKALKSLDSLAQLIRAKGLGARWKLELELGQVLYGSSEGAAQRTKLEDISARAGVAVPVVRNRAEVAIGASFLSEGKLGDAEKIFKAVVADPKADDRTLAAAHSGLGTCLFRRGEAAADPVLLSSALKSYMRVAVLYKNEVNYLPESLFFAGRSFQLIGGEGAEDNATKLYNKVIRNFPESRWAVEAKGFRKKKKKK